ncbi:hypothetical protein [Parvibaculum sp.]|uniref:hypothetical protein n=1 Tax=Parvibaculum sp. TaxID=2024848 RepID=UPI00391C803F
MTDLLQFPDDETKAFRRARAERVRQAEYEARVVQSCVVLLNDCIASRPDGAAERPALALARWVSEAHSLLREIKAQPAQIRSEVHVTGLCLRLKGLVEEAEHARFILVDRALAAAPWPADCFDMAREVNDDLRNRLGASRISPGQAPEKACGGARRAPVAVLTPDLVSDDLCIPGVPLAGRCAAGPLPSPQETGGGAAAAGSIGGRSVGTEPVLGIAEGDTRGLRPSRLVRVLFHGATLPRVLRKVLEKARGIFSRKGGAA